MQMISEHTQVMANAWTENGQWLPWPVCPVCCASSRWEWLRSSRTWSHPPPNPCDSAVVATVCCRWEARHVSTPPWACVACGTLSCGLTQLGKEMKQKSCKVCWHIYPHMYMCKLFWIAEKNNFLKTLFLVDFYAWVQCSSMMYWVWSSRRKQ